MPNGSTTLFAGRASGSIFTGRAAPTIMAGAMASAFSPGVFRAGGGLCQPIVQCCCKGPVTIAPGQIESIILNWAGWVDSRPDYKMNEVVEASLIDPIANPQVPADPDIIKIVSGRDGDNNPPANDDAKHLISLIPPYGTQVLIEASKDARIGAQFKLTVCLVLRDCDGRKIRQCDCVVVTIAEC